MKLPPDEIRQRFKACDLKMTPQRAAIYQALVETTSHPTAEDLHRQVTKVHPMISPNTVYYTLGALRDAGLVREVNYWHDRARFDANMALHHHLICLNCRRIQDLMDDVLDGLMVSRERRAGFEVTEHRVEFYGFCAVCSRRGGRATRSSHRSYR